jgi:hypothetical protein
LVQLRTAEIAKLQIVNPAMHMSGSMASIRRSGRSARTGRALPAAAV